ncbi:DnaJ domain protein [compost metagenome]
MSQVSRVQTSTPKGKYPAPTVRPQRKAHTLNAAQTQAFNFFSIYNHDFSPGFTNAELRKAFRKSALALHPDHGGNAQQFMELKEHYATLQGVFTK